MVIDMNETQLKTVAQLRAFLNGTPNVQFQSIGDDAKRYEFITAVLKRLCYPRLGRTEKGVVLRYLERLTGYPRQQVTRRVRHWLDFPFKILGFHADNGSEYINYAVANLLEKKQNRTALPKPFNTCSEKVCLNRTYAGILSRSRAGNGVWGFLRMRWRLN
jgi:hypothetical protein